MKKLQETIQETLQRGWTDISATITNIEEEVIRRFHRAREVMDPRQAKEEAQRALSDLARRMQESQEHMEQRVEETVSSVMSRFRGTLSSELSSLRARAEQLSQRIESQVRRRARSTEDAPRQGEPRDG
jgi:SMC interacting uncharacterized protein involved in chromosome segregation